MILFIMKRFLLIALLVLGFSQVYAQRFGYINSDVIVRKMPEYQEAEKELDNLVQTWQSEIDKKKVSLDNLRASYAKDELMLTQEMKKVRLAEVKSKEDELRDYQSNAFGFDGLLFKKRQELIKPLQEKIFEASEKVAKQKKVDFLFDKAGDLVMLYTNPRHNYTDYVLEELGLGDPIDSPNNQ